MGMITFKEYLVGNNSDIFADLNLFVEMAAQKDIVNMPVLIDENDLQFLRQFPESSKFWGSALFQRYDKYLRNALKVRCEQNINFANALFNEFEQIALVYKENLKNNKKPQLTFESIKKIGNDFKVEIDDSYIKNLESKYENIFSKWIRSYLENPNEKDANINLNNFASYETHNVLKTYKPFPEKEGKKFNPDEKDEYKFSEGVGKHKKVRIIRAYSYITPLIAKLEQDKGEEHHVDSGLKGIGKYGIDLSSPHYRDKKSCQTSEGKYEIYGLIIPTEETFKSTIKKFLSDNFHEYYGVVHDFLPFSKSKGYDQTNSEGKKEKVAPDLVSLAKYHKDNLLDSRKDQEIIYYFLNLKNKFNENSIEEMRERYGDKSVDESINTLKNLLNTAYCRYKDAIQHTETIVQKDKTKQEKTIYPDIVVLAKYYQMELTQKKELGNFKKIIEFIKFIETEQDPCLKNKNFKSNTNDPSYLQKETFCYLIKRYTKPIVLQAAEKLKNLYESLQNVGMDSEKMNKILQSIPSQKNPKEIFQDAEHPINVSLKDGKGDYLRDDDIIKSFNNLFEARFSSLIKKAIMSDEVQTYEHRFSNKQGEKKSIELKIYPMYRWGSERNKPSEDPFKFNEYLEKYNETRVYSPDKLKEFKDTYFKAWNEDKFKAKKILVRERQFIRSEAEFIAKDIIKEMIEKEGFPLPHSTNKNHPLYTGDIKAIVQHPYKDENGKIINPNIVLPHYESEVEELENGTPIKKRILVPHVFPSKFLRRLDHEEDYDEDGNLKDEIKNNLVGFHKDKIKVDQEDFAPIANKAGSESKQALNLNANQTPITSYPKGTPLYMNAKENIDKKEHFIPRKIKNIHGPHCKILRNALIAKHQKGDDASDINMNEYEVRPVIYYAIANSYSVHDSSIDKEKIIDCFQDIVTLLEEQINDNLANPIINYPEETIKPRVSSYDFEEIKNLIPEIGETTISDEVLNSYNINREIYDSLIKYKKYETFLQEIFPDDFYNIYEKNKQKKFACINFLSVKINSIVQKRLIGDCKKPSSRRVFRQEVSRKTIDAPQGDDGKGSDPEEENKEKLLAMSGVTMSGHQTKDDVVRKRLKDRDPYRPVSSMPTVGKTHVGEIGSVDKTHHFYKIYNRLHEDVLNQIKTRELNDYKSSDDKNKMAIIEDYINTILSSVLKKFKIDETSAEYEQVLDYLAYNLENLKKSIGLELNKL